MPRSKRNKIVHLTQVKKKTVDHKKDLLVLITQLIEARKFVYIFDFSSTKSDTIMKLRTGLKDIGKIFAGKNSIATLAFREHGKKTKTNFSTLTKQLAGHRGLLFADIARDELVARLDKEYPEFCKKLVGFAEIAQPEV